MAPSARAVLSTVEKSGVPFRLHSGWDDPALAAPIHWDPAYVIVHHTANGGAKGDAPSLNHILHGSFPPVRNAHFLVARSGLVHVCYALAGYHAGLGGPGKWGDGPWVPENQMNGRSYGIEIESYGMSLDTSRKGGTDGITDEQWDSTARLAKALCEMLGSDEGRVLNHKTWAPYRKVDTRASDATWRQAVRNAGKETDVALDKGDAVTVWNRPVREYVDENGNGTRDVRTAIDLLAATHKAALTAATKKAEADLSPEALDVLAQKVAALIAPTVANSVADVLAQRLKS